MGKKAFSFEQVRRKLKDGQEEALLRKLWVAAGGETNGGYGLQAILRGESRIELVYATVKLIDATGRCIVPARFKFEVVDPNKNFSVTQPELDLRAIHARVRQFLPSEFEIVTIEQFIADYNAIMAEIADNKQVANVKNGVCLPLPIPKHDIGSNYGKVLEDTYLKIVEASYLAAFPKPRRTFENWRRGELKRQVTVVDGTRHDYLIRTMRERPCTGVYCLPLQGWSIPADREFIKVLPENWLLAGAIDTSLALVAYPQTLAHAHNVPAIDCAANQWQGPENSLCFDPLDLGLGFVRRLLSARGDYSGGVLVLRQS